MYAVLRKRYNDEQKMTKKLLHIERLSISVINN